MNKRGDKIISVYWFAILFIVAAGVVYMASVFYGAPYDVREIEADILADKIAECISEGGKLNEDWGKLNENNLLEICDLNFDVEEFRDWDNDQHYVEINYYAVNIATDGNMDLGSKTPKSSAGDSGLIELCDFKGDYSSVCLERRFYVLDGNNRAVIEIKSIVKKIEKNVK